ncbi:hypothetical protein N752_10625 [Desulforamulus aquiferis]|nr:hypothetical protein N752_10625 [Desulforamulus aquiferis]
MGDTKKVLESLLVRLEKRKNPSWIETVSFWKKDLAFKYNEGGEILKPQYVIEEIYRHTGGDVIMATDVGSTKCGWPSISP